MTAGEIDRSFSRQASILRGSRPQLGLGAVAQGRRQQAILSKCADGLLAWEQIHALYRLTAPAPIPNLQPRFNACPTDPADTVVEHEGKRALYAASSHGCNFGQPEQLALHAGTGQRQVAVGQRARAEQIGNPLQIFRALLWGIGCATICRKQ